MIPFHVTFKTIFFTVLSPIDRPVIHCFNHNALEYIRYEPFKIMTNSISVKKGTEGSSNVKLKGHLCRVVMVLKAKLLGNDLNIQQYSLLLLIIVIITENKPPRQADCCFSLSVPLSSRPVSVSQVFRT